jgi:hypothetical protein
MIKVQRELGIHKDFYLFVFILPRLCPYPGKSESPVKEKEHGEDDFDLFGEVLKTGADKEVDSKEKVEQHYCNGDITGIFPHIYLTTSQ